MKTVLFLASFMMVSVCRAIGVEEIRKKLADIPPERNFRARAVLLNDLGTQLYKEGRWDEAIEAFDNALSYGPPTVLKKHIHLYMGKSYESSGRLDKALTSYEQAALFDKRNWRRHRDLAGLYERADLIEKAVGSYAKALRYNPRESSVHFALGRLDRRLARYEQAETHFLAALEYGQNQNDVFAELSLVFEAQGKFSEAAAAANEVTGGDAPAADWARLTYLSILGRQDDLIAKSFEGLKKKGVSEETIRFYEALKRYIGANPSQDDARFAAQLKDILK